MVVLAPMPPRVLAAFAGALGCVLAGCAAPRKTSPPGDPARMSDIAFQAYLQTVSVVTVDEAYRAIDILVNGEQASATFEARRDKLESQGISKPAWGLRRENMIDAGAVGYMVLKACHLRGGVSYSLFGTVGLGDRRYALRELIYREMVEEIPDYQFIKGSTFSALLAKADALMAAKNLYPSQRIQLSDETDRDEKGDLIVPPPITTKPSGE